MHINGNMRTMSATTQVRVANNAARKTKVNKKGEARDMGPAAIVMSTIVVGALMTSGKLLVWAVIAVGIWFVYGRIGILSRVALIAASAATAFSFLSSHVFSA